MLHLVIGFMSFMMLVFSGCAIFTPPKEHPVQYDWVPLSKWLRTSYGSVFSMTPERRTVIVIPKPETAVKICAESPPDVAESMASAIRFAAEAQVKGYGGKVDLSSIFSSSAMMLFYRSQGVQLFRDGMYNLCQAHMNGLIDQNQYLIKYEKLLDIAQKLIESEIPAMQAIKIAEAVERAKAQKVAETASEAVKISKDATGKALKDIEAAEKALEDVKKLLGETKLPEKPPATPKPPKLEQFSGTIKSVDKEAKSIIVTNKEKVENTFVVDEKTTKITRDTKDLPPTDLKDNMSVDVEYKKERDKMIATAIKVSTPPAAPATLEPPKSEQFSGTIKSDVDANAKSIVVTDEKVEKTFVVDEKVVKITKDKETIKIGDLKAGMNVAIEYKKEGDKMIATAIKVSGSRADKRKSNPKSN